MAVVLVGVWLATLGCADLGRPAADWPARGRMLACLGVGAAVLALGLGVVDLGWRPRLVLLVVLGVLLCGWECVRSRLVATAALAGGLLVAVLAGGAVRADRDWPGWLEGTVPAMFDSSLVIVVIGVVIFQLSTANLLVRLLLDAVGVPATTNEKQLKGGRVLGPMERVLLVTLGALGEVSAAAIVVAAKGLLRFPELQRAQRRATPELDGPSDVTEYFLIGSLASWLLALAGAGLIHLAG